jgi:hypothetical protein
MKKYTEEKTDILILKRKGCKELHVCDVCYYHIPKIARCRLQLKLKTDVTWEKTESKIYEYVLTKHKLKRMKEILK